MRVAQSILQRVGIRQLPGICWYPAKRTEHSVNQGGTADKVYYSSLTDYIFCQGLFCAHQQSQKAPQSGRMLACGPDCDGL